MGIIRDTLRKPNGRWDKQALTMFVSFIITIILGLGNTVMSYVFEIYQNEMAENIFNTFAILTGTLSGTNIGNKLVDMSRARNNKDKEEQVDINQEAWERYF